MLRTAALLALSAGAWLVALLWWRATFAADERRDLVALKLTFPRRLPADAITDFISATSGLRMPWWKARIFVCPVVVFEAVATSAGVTFWVVVNERRRARVEQMLRAHLPQVRYERTPPPPQNGVGRAAAYRLSTARRELRLSPAQISGGLLHSLGPLDADEQVVLQWIVTPAAVPLPPQTARARSSAASNWWPFANKSRSHEARDSAEATAWRTKQRLPQSHASLRIGAKAATVELERRLVRRVETGLHPTSNPGVQFRRRWLPARRVGRALERRLAPIGVWPVTVNAAELAQLLAWPIEAVEVPGVALAGCRQLPVPMGVATAGTVIGDGFATGQPRVAALDQPGRFRHLALSGPTGTGKTTLLTGMIGQDIEAGHGVFVLDPKDLSDEVLARVPDHRRDQVVVLDPSDAARPVGIQPLGPSGNRDETSVEHLVSVCRRVFAGDYGVWTDELLRFGLRSLLHDPDATLVDLLALFGEPSFRARIVAAQTDVVTRSYWAQFNALSAAEQALRAAPLMTRLRAIFGRPSLRRVFGQPNPAFDLAGHLNQGGIVIASVRPGAIGEEAANLYSSILLGLLWNTVQARAAQPASRRHALMVYLDEFARSAVLPVPWEAMLAMARSNRVGVTVALQYLEQLPVETRAGVLQNVRSLAAFQANSADARLLAREMGGALDADDLQGLARWELAARLYGDGATQRPCTLLTRNLSAAGGDAEVLRAASAARWGADGDAVESYIDARLAPSTESDDEAESDAASRRAGRKRRAS